MELKFQRDAGPNSRNLKTENTGQIARDERID